jgi:PIF1-like helicase
MFIIKLIVPGIPVVVPPVPIDPIHQHGNDIPSILPDEVLPRPPPQDPLQVIILQSSTDYLHRPDELLGYSFVEFVTLTNKKQNPPPSVARSAAGRPENWFGFFQNFKGEPHLQVDSHRITLWSKIRFPLFSGSRVPKHPGIEPDENRRSAHNVWKREIDDFGTFFLTAFVPWDRDTGRPPFQFNYDGLEEWLRREDIEDIEDRYRAVNDPVHQGILRYIDNCVVAANKSKFHEITMTKFRQQSADTKQQYLDRQAAGVPEGQGNAGDRGYTTENPRGSNGQQEPGAVDRSEEICNTIMGLRSDYEGNPNAPLDAHELETLVNIRDLCTHSRQGAILESNVRSACVVDTDLGVIEARYRVLRDYIRPTTTSVDGVPDPTLVVSNVNITRNEGGQVNIGIRDSVVSLETRIAELTSRIDGIGFLPDGVTRRIPLNDRQRLFYNSCAEHAEEVYRVRLFNRSCLRPCDEREIPQLFKLLIGGPGTGKTYLLSCIQDKFNIEAQRFDNECLNACLCCAPTAVAALLQVGGTTIHTLCSIDANTTQLRRMDQDTTLIMTNNYKKCDLLSCDEISMLSSILLNRLSARFKNLLIQNKPFGGVSLVILTGDFTQLPPGVGKSIMFNIIDDRPDDLARLLRQFVRTVLTEQMRASLDEWQTELVNTLRSVIDGNYYPLRRSSNILDSSCVHCVANNNRPTRQCRHLHPLQPIDIIENPRWLSEASVINPGHGVSNRIMETLICQFAISTGQIVLRWRLPPTSTNPRPSTMQYNAACSDVRASCFTELWGYFVKDLPIRITHNCNIPAKVVNGSRGTLISFRPVNTGVIRTLLGNNSLPRGSMHTIDCPLGVTINVPDAIEDFQNITFTSDYIDGQKRRREVKIGPIRGVPVTIYVIDPGYVCDLTGTTYAFQGQTIDYAIINLNYNHNAKLTLAHVLVALSRVRDSHNLRIVPWSNATDPKKHLFEMRFPNEYLIWNGSYDDDGRFNVNTMRNLRANLIVPAYVSEPIVRPVRGIPGLMTSGASLGHGGRGVRNTGRGRSNTGRGSSGSGINIPPVSGGENSTVGGMGVGGRESVGRGTSVGRGRGVGGRGVGGRGVGGRGGASSSSSIGGSGSNMAGAGSSNSSSSGGNMAGAGGSSSNNSGTLAGINPNLLVQRVEQANGTIQQFLPNIPPTARQQFNTLLTGTRSPTQSWVFIKFLASVFECDISIFDTNRFIVEPFWREGHNWDSDSQLLRDYLKTFPNHLYDRLRNEFGYDTNYNAYPHALEQDVVLGQWKPGERHRSEIHSLATRELFDYFKTHSNIYENALEGIRVVGNRLCDAVLNMKLKVSNDYQAVYGIDVNVNQLVHFFPNGMQPPFIDTIRDYSPLPDYNV